MVVVPCCVLLKLKSFYPLYYFLFFFNVCLSSLIITFVCPFCKFNTFFSIVVIGPLSKFDAFFSFLLVFIVGHFLFLNYCWSSLSKLNAFFSSPSIVATGPFSFLNTFLSSFSTSTTNFLNFISQLLLLVRFLLSIH